MDDPTREVDCAGLTIRVHGKDRSLLELYEENGVLQRFRQVQELMMHAYELACRSFHTTFSFPADYGIAGYDPVRPGEFGGDGLVRPFASPKFWAAFVVTGDGARCEPGPIGDKPGAEVAKEGGRPAAQDVAKETTTTTACVE